MSRPNRCPARRHRTPTHPTEHPLDIYGTEGQRFDVDASERFYTEVFGLERVAAPNFGFPVRWLRLGSLQLHLQTVNSDLRPRSYQHFAIEVDDFVAAYRALRERDAFEQGTRYASIWLLPSGEVQMFVRDPSDNLIEIDLRDASTIDLAVFDGQLRVLADEVSQSPSDLAATLFLPGARAAGRT